MEGDVPMRGRHVRIFAMIIGICLLTVTASCGKQSSSDGGSSFQDYYAEHRQKDEMPAGMANDLAVISPEEQKAMAYGGKDGADLLIDEEGEEVLAARHCFDKLYPASITKVMTALLVIEYIEKGKGSWEEEIVLDHNIDLGDDQAVASTLTRGCRVSVGDVFHTMLIKSANDCAVILAEYVSGSEEKFVKKMNKKALTLGATHTHFVNTNGLHDPDHYTTAYDLYLIFREACKSRVFVETVSSSDYTMNFTNAYGAPDHEYMESTNHYLLNEYSVPEGVVMAGGKTGTTSLAGSCLILMTENENGDRFYSEVLGAKTKDQLYASMTRLLEQIPQ
jgi:D-alanyl-D-alanine carboxypeptidase (penicillin-binding protein 5/6)